MAKKNELTIDTVRSDAKIQTFETKRQKFTVTYNAYKSSYFKTCGDATVVKLRKASENYYKEIDSLYKSFYKYTRDFIESMKALEQKLKNQEFSGLNEQEVSAIIASVNDIINGIDPSDIEITEDGNIIINDAYDRRNDIDPKINGSLIDEHAREINRDGLVHAYVAHPKFTSFMAGIIPIPLEWINTAKYNAEQVRQVKTVKKENAKWNTAGEIAGYVLLGLLGPEAAGVKAVAKGGGKAAIKQVAKSAVLEKAVEAPLDALYAIKDGYDVGSRKVNWKDTAFNFGVNFALDFGVTAITKGGVKTGVAAIKDSNLAKNISNVFGDAKLKLRNNKGFLDLNIGKAAKSTDKTLNSIEKKAMKYSSYETKQFTERKVYNDLCKRFIDITDNKETKKAVESIVYDGGYKNFSVESGLTRNNITNAMNKRLGIADVAINNPETFKYLVDHNINLFHGTGGEVLPSVADNGLLSLKASNDIGNKVNTGEEWSRTFTGERNFVSFTDDINTAEYYAGNNENYKFPIIFGTTVDDAKELGYKTIATDLVETGINYKVPKENIKVIMTPSENIPEVKKIIGNEIPVLPLDNIDKKFYYMDDFGGLEFYEKAYDELKNTLNTNLKKESSLLNRIKAKINSN